MTETSSLHPVAVPGSDPEALISTAKAAMAVLKKGYAEDALAMLKPWADTRLAAAQLQTMARLGRALAQALPGLPAVRIAFGAHATLDDLVGALHWHLLLKGWRLEPLVIPYATWPQEVRDTASALYRFSPEMVWLFLDGSPLSGGSASAELTALLETLAGQVGRLQQRLGALVIVNNLVRAPWPVFGNLEAVVPGAPAQAVQAFNQHLPAALPAGASTFDMAHLASAFGLLRWHDERLRSHAKYPFSLDAHSDVAHAMASHVLAAKGRARKCVVLDLDNTLWGGVVGDDGVEGIVIGTDNGAAGESFQRFQQWLKALNRRGIVLAVCSKNEETIARRPFTERTGMALRLEDFAAFTANWRNKADNIRDIARRLNLGLDALVFVDDNSAERALVRAELPEVAVPDMPADPADYVEAVARGRWFETLAVSTEDLGRADAYRGNFERERAAGDAADLPTYLRGLEMVSRWGAVDAATLARTAQLINKTNQFHLTSTRYTEAQVRHLAESGAHWVGQFSLADRFGDHGLTSVVVLAFHDGTARIDTWAMSCRVFSRTFEQFIFNRLVGVARARGCHTLVGEYRATARNAVVAPLYAALGGIPLDPPAAVPSQAWSFDLQGANVALPTYVADGAAPATPEST